MEEDIRWKQRFENFERAYQKLQKTAEAYQENPIDFMQMALIKAFEMTFELGWKTAKDYLKHGGIKVSLPRDVIKEAFANGVIKDGQVWIDMLDDRNLMSHTYDEECALKAIDHICHRYIVGIEQLYQYFSEKTCAK